jgi:hypothetical protein
VQVKQLRRPLVSVPKILLDLQVENTSVLEDAEKAKFDVMNRLLTAENDAMQLDLDRQV